MQYTIDENQYKIIVFSCFIYEIISTIQKINSLCIVVCFDF